MKRWTIGNRGKRQADLGLEDNTVSALHASLTQTDDGRWVIEDRNSTNGTARIVNGQWVRIRQAIVQPDERLRFGRAETTVRQLLQLPRDAGSVAGSSATVRWNQDLALAFSEIRSFSELKKNILFVMDLLSAPTRQIMRCAMRRRPVNPFSFMLFGGLIYTVITASGLSITSALNLQGAKEQSEFLENVLRSVPSFILPLTLTLTFNAVSFWIFRYFSYKERNFDDFMRVMAVASGMSWMLGSFLALLANDIWTDHLNAAHATQSVHAVSTPTNPGHNNQTDNATRFILIYVLSVIIFLYINVFNIIAHKQFWNITYGRAVICYLLVGFLVFMGLAIVLMPIGIVYVAYKFPG